MGYRKFVVAYGNLYVCFNMICYNRMMFIKKKKWQSLVAGSAFVLLAVPRVYHDLRKGDGILEHSSQPCKRIVPTASVSRNKNTIQVKKTKEQKAETLQTNHAYARVLVYACMSSVSFAHHATHLSPHTSKPQAEVINIPYPMAFPYGNGMVLHFYQQQESSTTKTVHRVINKGLKAYV